MNVWVCNWNKFRYTHNDRIATYTVSKHYLLWFGKFSLWFSVQNTAGKTKNKDSIQKVKACYFSDRQHSLTLKRKSQECPTFHWILGQALSFFMWIMWMSLGLLFVDVVFPHLQNIRAHEPLFCESNAAALFQSKEQSTQVFTAGPWRISTWARHRLSKEPTLDSSTLGSCLCPVISASLSFYADPRLLNHGSHCA